MTKQLKNIDFWEGLLKDIPHSYKQLFIAEKDYIRKTITKNSIVLDIGCGNGRTLNSILDITQNLFGIDNEEKAVENTRKNLKLIPNAQILLGDVRKLPFENKFFDFIICVDSFVNFGEYKFKALEEMKRVLKDDGIIILSVFSEDAFEERMKQYKKYNSPIKEIKGTTVYFDFETEGENLSEQFSKKDIESIATKAKLKLLDIKKEGIGYICKLGKQK